MPLQNELGSYLDTSLNGTTVSLCIANRIRTKWGREMHDIGRIERAAMRIPNSDLTRAMARQVKNFQFQAANLQGISLCNRQVHFDWSVPVSADDFWIRKPKALALGQIEILEHLFGSGSESF